LANQVSAQQIYAEVMQKKHALTMEQQNAVNDASHTSPSLVVAGAGSGKTELMAVRVLWLVANGHARPEQILGLTFTRKAASELKKRIYENLVLLKASAYWPFGPEVEVLQPTVTTYNSYANSIYRENALGLGYENDSVLLTEAAAFQLCREIVVKYGAEVDARLADLDIKLNTIIDAVMKLAGAMNDNGVSAEDIEAICDGVVGRFGGLPKKASGSDFTQFGYYPDILEPFGETTIIAKLADAYRAKKREMGFVDYSDQVALAELAARTLPGVVEAQRQQFSQVLLDEYQDTSVLQTRLLSKLFKGTSVFAVGDPNQSIYGWRGASASNLAAYAQDFCETPEQARRLTEFQLSTSWRNPRNVLQLANHLALELGTPPSYLSADAPRLTPLTLMSRSDAGEGEVEIRFDQTIDDEAKSVAEWFKYSMPEKPDSQSNLTAAVLMRKKANMHLFVEALEDQGIEVEVVGLGGLLEMPEIIDLVAALYVVHDPSRGSQLVRLLSGARWRIGPKDIADLYDYARKRNQNYLKDEDSVAPEDGLSLIDALDMLRDPGEWGYSKIEEPALSRLVNAAELFHNLRKRAGLPLTDFVRLVERELWLDIEVSANPKHRRKNPMAHLNAFATKVAEYAASNHRPYLGAFLNWLETASERERIEAPSENPAMGVVQVLTVHSAKGLEWDLVAIPNLVKGDFPSTGKNTSGWLTRGELPYPLRGDRHSLPVWDTSGVESQPELKKSKEAFTTQVKEHLRREEIRLMYVAVTRPKAKLLMTGSYWKTGKKPLEPSEFLFTAAQLPSDVVVVSDHTGNPDYPFPANRTEENARELSHKDGVWPLEPLGEVHQQRVELAGQDVLTAFGEQAVAAQSLVNKDLSRQPDIIDLLIAERDQRARANQEIQLPIRINASGFKDYVTKPDKTAEKMLRPMPEEPYKATRAGTIFHNMMEQRFAGIEGLMASGDYDSDPGSIQELGLELWAQQLSQVDLAEHKETINDLQAQFEKSRWANQIPAAVEIEIQLAVNDNIFICKLDAVFETENGYEVVDWKTGVAPKGEQEVEERSLQLALYRWAFATLKGIPLEKVSASLYYVTTNEVVTPEPLLDRDQLLERWAKVVG
jgi:DNA helicase-2/ATP-dependent DNA helicase PcrA